MNYEWWQGIGVGVGALASSQIIINSTGYETTKTSFLVIMVVVGIILIVLTSYYKAKRG